MKLIKAVLVDDERSAREEVKRMLIDYPDIIVAAEAANANEARKLIKEFHPDLLFLDIQMPGETGFELLESLTEVPMVIFVTAYDQHAIKAFDVSAIDYLLKPIRDERFAKAIELVRNKHLSMPVSQVFIREGDKLHLLRWSEVHLVESLDNYAGIWTGNKKLLMKSSLNQLQEKLDKEGFFRANRAQLINLRYIDQVTYRDAQILAMLTNGISVKISSRQAVKLKEIMRHSF